MKNASEVPGVTSQSSNGDDSEGATVTYHHDDRGDYLEVHRPPDFNDDQWRKLAKGMREWWAGHLAELGVTFSPNSETAA